MGFVFFDIKNGIRKIGYFFRRLIHGDFYVSPVFTENVVFILVVFFLIILYGSNRYFMEGAMRKERELTKKNDDLRYELLSVSAKLTEMSKGSIIEDSVKAKIPELEIPKTASFVVTKK